jgi:hypothetical protein
MFPVLEPFLGPGVPVQLITHNRERTGVPAGGKEPITRCGNPGRTGFVWREKSRWPLETLASESKRPR